MAKMQGLLFFENEQFGSKIQIAKKVQETILQVHYSESVKKTAPETS